jgi:HK97 family phage major capsid protein
MAERRYSTQEIGQAHLRSMYLAHKGGQSDVRDTQILASHDDSPSAHARIRDEVQNYAEEQGLLPHQTNRVMTAVAGSPLRPPQMLSPILVYGEMHSVARRLFRPARFVGGELHCAGVATTVVAAWVNQAASAGLKDFTFAKGVLKPSKIAYVLPFSREHQEDSSPDLAGATFEACGRANGLLTDQAAFLGTGGDDFGGFTGILTGSSRVVTMTSGKVSIYHAALDDLKSLVQQIPSGQRKGCVFFLGGDFLLHILGLKDAQGRYYVQADGFGGVWLFGYRVEVVPALDGIVDGPSVPFAAFGNPAMALFATRSELSITFSEAGILLNEEGALIVHNAIMTDLLLAFVSERVAIGMLDASAFAVLKTAAA